MTWAQTVTAYQSGRRRMPVSSIPFIARSLDTTVEELIGEKPATASSDSSSGNA